MRESKESERKIERERERACGVSNVAFRDGEKWRVKCSIQRGREKCSEKVKRARERVKRGYDP